ncbi:MAG: hypothetical protein V1728_05270 [Candidatus Micrarchaeota archaeon]
MNMWESAALNRDNSVPNAFVRKIHNINRQLNKNPEQRFRDGPNAPPRRSNWKLQMSVRA